MVQWLGCCAFTAEGMGSIPGWGTKVPQAEWPPPKKCNTNKNKMAFTEPSCPWKSTIHP